MDNTWSQSAGKSYAYILGVYLGDGNVTVRSEKNIIFRLNTIDRDFAEATRKAMLEVTKRDSNIYTEVVKKSSKPNHALQCSCGPFGLHLKEVTQNKAVIPSFVYQWDNELKKSFVSGLMDSEGFVAEGKNRITLTPCRYFMGFGCCDLWFMDFKKILESLGIQTGKVKQEILKSGKMMRRLHIHLRSWIQSGCIFQINRKQRRVDEYAKYEPYTLRSRYPRRLSPETTRQTPERVMI
jgi:hypothetical protein